MEYNGFSVVDISLTTSNIHEAETPIKASYDRIFLYSLQLSFRYIYSSQHESRVLTLVSVMLVPFLMKWCKHQLV
jgi:hypothetical protein